MHPITHYFDLQLLKRAVICFRLFLFGFVWDTPMVLGGSVLGGHFQQCKGPSRTRVLLAKLELQPFQ